MQDNEVQQSNNSSRLLLAMKETNNKNKNKSLQQQTSSWCPEPSTHINNPWTSDSGPRCVKRGLCRSKPRKKKKKKIMRALRSGPLLDPCTAAVGGWGSNVRWQPGKHTRPAVLHVPYICGGWRATWSRQPRVVPVLPGLALMREWCLMVLDVWSGSRYEMMRRQRQSHYHRMTRQE